MRIYFDENCALVGYYAASSDTFLTIFRDNLWVLSSGFKTQKITHILLVVLDRLHTQVNGLWRFNVKFLNQTTCKY